jgi:hypothetical protein
MDTREANPLYVVPEAPMVKSSSWGSRRLSGKGLDPLAGRLNSLREGGLTGVMVAKEFVRRRIAPPQDHRRKMWTFTGDGDKMMLHPTGLLVPTIDEAMKTLFAEVGVPDLTFAVAPLYRLQAREDILAAMPRFDQWGLRPMGQEGERENPLLPVLGSGPEEEAEEFEDADAGEAESSRTRQELSIQAISSDDEDAVTDFIVAPSRRASAGAEEEDAEARDEAREAEGDIEARDEAHEAEGNVEAHVEAQEAEGSPPKATAGRGGSSDAGTANS